MAQRRSNSEPLEKKPTIDEVSPREELVMLALYRKELYGLQIPEAMSQASNGQETFKIGSLYPTLHSLETKGFVTSRWGDEGRQERGGARRRYYKLTGQGEQLIDAIQEFRSSLISWQPV